MKNPLISLSIIGVSYLAGLGLGSLISPVTTPSQYPMGYIPLVEGSRIYSTTINSTEIVKIEPIFDPAIAVNKRKNKNVLHLELSFTDGTVIELKEDLDDLLNRIRNSMSQ